MKKSWKLLVSVLAVVLIVAMFSFLGGVRVGRSEFAGVGTSIPKYNQINFPFSYLIDTNSTHYFLGNATSWKWDYISTNVSKVVTFAIQNGTGLIFFNDGTYTFSNTISIAKSNIHLKGTSRNTILRSNGNINLFSIGSASASITDISFEDMTIQHWNTTYGYNLIDSSIIGKHNYRITEIHINNVGFHNVRANYWALNATCWDMPTITNSLFDSFATGGNGVWFYNYNQTVGSGNIYFADNTMSLLSNSRYIVLQKADVANGGINGDIFLGNHLHTTTTSTNVTILTLKGRGIGQTEIAENTFENAVNMILINGTSNTASTAGFFTKIVHNTFIYSITPVESGQKTIWLGIYALGNLIEGNSFIYGTSTLTGSVAILDQNPSSSLRNKIINNLYWYAETFIKPSNTTEISGNSGFPVLYPKGSITNPVNGTYLVDSGAGTIANNTQYTVTQSSKVIYLTGGTMIATYVNGVIVFTTATNIAVPLKYGETVKFQWSSAPTIKTMGE